MNIYEGEVGPRGPVVEIIWRGPSGREVRGDAIIDTGGSFTMIDIRVAERIGAPGMGKRVAKTACGSCDMGSVSAAILIGKGTWRTGTFEAAALGGQPPVVAVVGMDWLKSGRFSLDGPKRRWRFVVD